MRAQAVLAANLARFGQADEARAILTELQSLAGKRYVPPTSLAVVHAALGDPAAALAALENAVTVRDTRVIYLKDDPHWTVLHKEARFVALLRKRRLDRYGAGLSTI